MSDNGKNSCRDDGKEAPKTFDWMPAGCEALADGEYDAIVLGTGLTECILGSLLSALGKRVLQLDRNNYCGSDTASLSLQNLFQHFNKPSDPPTELGHSRLWSVDLVPKFCMACGNFTKILMHADITRFMEFKAVEGSYVFKDEKIYKVPANPGEALHSKLMKAPERRKLFDFLKFLKQYEKEKPARYLKGKRLEEWTTRQMYGEYGLDENTQAFTGHAMALYRDDDYLDIPGSAAVTADAIKLYMLSYELHGMGMSPFLYPMNGLGRLPESSSRLSAARGGTFMLNKGIDEVLFHDNGVAWGVKIRNEVAKAGIILGEPSYFSPSKCRTVGKVVRSICFLDHPIAGTEDAESVQIIIPASEMNRKNHIYICMVSGEHKVSLRKKFIATVSTTVETDAAGALDELAPGIALLGKIIERFDSATDLLEPLSDGKVDNCYISKSYDATSHFETVANDVLNLYTRITGKELDMSISTDMDEDDL